MSDENPIWPPPERIGDIWPPPWLRLEAEYPGSGRPSRLVSHSNVPFIAGFEDPGDPALVEAKLKKVAGNYLSRMQAFVGDDLGAPPFPDPFPNFLPDGWIEALSSDTDIDDAPLDWLDIWPPIDSDDTTIPPAPCIGSWNLGQAPDFALPATIIMTAAEVYLEPNNTAEFASFRFGIRVPMSVQSVEGGFRVVIRSMTAEFPARGASSFTEILKNSAAGALPRTLARLNGILGRVSEQMIDEEVAKSSHVSEATLRHESVSIELEDQSNFLRSPLKVTYTSKAAALPNPAGGHSVRPQFPKPRSFQVLSTFDVTINNDIDTFTLVSTETCPLATHAAAPGQAMVFNQTPPGWVDPTDPTEDYVFTDRRPSRADEYLERFRKAEQITGTTSAKLEDTGFRVRLCPEYVPADIAPAANNKKVKEVHLPGGQTPQPRRNDYSALMAYSYSVDFFKLLRDIGLDPGMFVVQAEKTAQIFYRYGIMPGPGKSGRTINAQVTFDCSEAIAGQKPPIHMNLALANLSRWDRPDEGSGRFGWPEPLGIATSGRWMMHEYGHYLLAARLGKLEFDFAHSAGDAMAAVYFDPHSRLADRRGGVADSFRGFTYPFVFAPRRHDRSPLLGWAWYGMLNRSVVEHPPAGCEITKGYLTEQILSSTIFRLYRSLGGDTMTGDAPDRYVRQRASFFTLFLLIRAIAGLTQSPSRAEMLELGMEDTSLLMMTPIPVPQDLSAPPPAADEWGGGLVHKVVRWAFEAQGMFPRAVTDIVNAPGRAPEVDIYVEDQRPTEEAVPAGRTDFGLGTYLPVSLDWTGERLWTVSDDFWFRVGNRGEQTAQSVTGRFWVGKLTGDMSQERWDLGQNIDWLTDAIPALVPSTLPGDPRPSEIEPPDEVKSVVDDELTAGQTHLLVLLEITDPDDLANTDPAADLAAAILNHQRPTKVPRALTDLVANDNNLGLKIIQLP